jgi:transcriptional regulator with XRE-family HTH domain
MITASQVKAARKLLGWTRQHCTNKAAVSLETLAHFEAGRKSQARTSEAIRSTLEATGVEFLRGGRVRFKERE